MTSGQNGGTGCYTFPPHTSKGRITNLKTKNKQNCQKTELYGSPATKALKGKHSSRQVGWAETGSQGGEDSAMWWLEDWVRWQQVERTVPHLHADKLGGTTGE